MAMVRSAKCTFDFLDAVAVKALSGVVRDRGYCGLVAGLRGPDQRSIGITRAGAAARTSSSWQRLRARTVFRKSIRFCVLRKT